MDHRTQTRRKTLKQGLLILRPGGPEIGCVIRDYSGGGARIWRPHWVRLPPRFKLVISGELALDVEVRWQVGQEAGLQFLGINSARSSVAAIAKGGISAA